jgi:hypothetical protein
VSVKHWKPLSEKEKALEESRAPAIANGVYILVSKEF